MGVHESGEMYLEAIYVLLREKGHARSVDVSEYLGYSKPSVSRAMGILRTGGYITVDRDGSISLTDAGETIAGKIYDRHMLLTKLLIHIGVSDQTAAEDACRMEHAISDESFEALKKFVAEKL